MLINSGIYPSKEIGNKLFDLEKSGFIAFIAAIISEREIEADNIVVNFTGRYIEANSQFPEPATPHIRYNPNEGPSKLLELLELK